MALNNVGIRIPVPANINQVANANNPVPANINQVANANNPVPANINQVANANNPAPANGNQVANANNPAPANVNQVANARGMAADNLFIKEILDGTGTSLILAKTKKIKSSLFHHSCMNASSKIFNNDNKKAAGW
ncbi:12750_t:CDS:2 [Entrophospora sp. SA101]|nr:12750_t:CDS:2 [Entrophospora sp. SA101]